MITSKERRGGGGNWYFPTEKGTTTSPGSHTAPSFMNRHTTRARVTWQSTAMSHFLNILNWVFYQMLSACCWFCSFGCNHLWLRACLSSQPQCLVYFWICVTAYFGSVLCLSSCLCWRFWNTCWMRFWISVLGGVSAGLYGGRGTRGRHTPCLANMLSRQLASPSTHKHRRTHAQREGSCWEKTLLCEANDSELWGFGSAFFHSSLWSVKNALSGKTSHRPHSFSLDSNNGRRPC